MQIEYKKYKTEKTKLYEVIKEYKAYYLCTYTDEKGNTIKECINKLDAKEVKN